jgi:hypothetical protein
MDRGDLWQQEQIQHRDDDDGSDDSYGASYGDSDQYGDQSGDTAQDVQDVSYGVPGLPGLAYLTCEWGGEQYPLGTELYQDRGPAYGGFPCRGMYRCTSYQTYADWAPIEGQVECKENDREPWPSERH